ncbi:carbohydrate ABC transporter permease [Saccharomonospora viridis]|jgi:raffinose/stachyose/melibiose transport system permease protein|uniref:Carbohydrate ABC transporter membrane protein n=2 Tax=Saccharomonospora viridis TaxID=1852 RepID=C7MXR8_SACVD|nr:carbohydrate ABC transporter permease [Saccharomonospora viridis]ACU97347.1 carbohydrate ABC transporter membrane protein [Saccharomonospora viridis DSM 43017]SFP83133.1 raffinose/stachyose/melibiose transport system permease protein [Saccharomonospora viridis]
MTAKVRTRPNVLGGLAGFAWLLVVLVPVYYVVITSLRDQEGFFSSNPLAPPADPTLDSYRLVLENDFLRYLGNSVVVTLATVLITVSVSLLAAYYVVRGGGRLARLTYRSFLLGLAIPLQATIIPVYYLITQIQLYDTLWAIILPSAAFAIPLSVVILANFLRDVPNELFESMRMDGAGHWRMVWSLVLPLTRPAVVTVAVYDALQVWNGFLFPLILTQSPDQRVLPLALWSFQGQFTVNIPAVLAAVVLSTLPVLALYILGRRQLIGGLTAGFGR